MVLDVASFRIQPSFKKKIRQFRQMPFYEIRFDSAFDQVIQACASSARDGQAGTWIVPEMIAAYGRLHRAGFAHSVETWVDGELAGGLYCVAMGKAVFGESMFSRVSDASKMALAALVGFCRHHGIAQIDCQQNTAHLALLGAAEIARSLFLKRVSHGLAQTGPDWVFDSEYWHHLLASKAVPT